MKRKLLLICGLIGLTLSPWTLTSASAQRPQRGEDSADRERGGQRGGDRNRGGGPGGMAGRGGPGGFRGGGPGGGGPGGDPGFALLRSPEIRTELELMPEQEEALKELEKRGRERPQGDGEGFDPRKFDFRNASEDERAEMFKKIQAMREEQAGKMREQLEEVLFPEQMERLEQLSIQMRGMTALADPKVQEQIGVTEDQLEKLKQFRSEQETKMRESMRDAWQSGDREGIREKMKEMRDEAEAAVMKQLEPEQREKFEKMKGEPFDFSKLQRPDQRRGDRGFGGRGGDRESGGRRGGGDRGAGRERDSAGGRRPSRPESAEKD